MKLTFKPTKKHFYWTGGVLLLLLLLQLGFNSWIKAKVPAIIEERNDTAYNFNYENLKFSLIGNSISVEGVSIQPKKNHTEKIPIDFTANVKEIKVVGVNFFKLLRKKDLSAYSIVIKNPKVVYNQPTQRDTTRTSSKLGSVIQVSTFEIQDAYFEMFRPDKTTKLVEIKDLDIELGGVNLSQRTLEKDIPFTYSDFEMTSGKIFYRLNQAQELHAGSLKINDNLFHLNQFEISSDESISKLDPKKIDFRIVPDVKAPTVSFTGLDWGISTKNDYYFKAEILKFDSIDVQVLNTRERPTDTVVNRGSILPFQLDIAKIFIDNSRFRIKNALDAKNLNLQIEQVKNRPNEKLSIENFLVKNPEIMRFTGKRTDKNADKTAEDFVDHIQIKNFEIQNASYKMNELNGNKNLLIVNDLNFSLQAIQMTPESYKEKIPVTYEKMSLTAKSLDFNPNSIYNLKTQNISFVDGNLKVQAFEMKPKVSRSQFVKQLAKEKDLYTLSAKSIAIPKMNWGFKGDALSFSIPQMDIKTVHANVYRSKIPPDDLKKKNLYSKLLRDLPFYLEINQLNMKDSQVEYEEETLESTGAGKLIFSNFNANVRNIYSGFGRSKLPDVVATINANFMNDSKVKAVWTFNPLNRNENFNIKGSLFDFDASKMTPFVKPYLHASMVGNMQEVRFNFNGNDVSATGDFGIKYQNLKVTLYNPETGKQRKVLNTVGNLFVKSGTKDQYQEVAIKPVLRKQDRSFFNFFWNCVLQGLKQSLLIV